MDALVREPIYLQMNHRLRQLLQSAEYGPGQKFLTEREVSARFGVSRVTANKALASLVSEKLLEFRKGVGTFVLAAPLDYNLRALVSFTREVEAAGKVPSTEVLRFEKTTAGEHAVALNRAANAPVYFMERLRLADGLPVILERRHVPVDAVPGLRATDLGGSIYRLWLEKYRYRIGGARQSIRAVNLQGEDAKKLRVQPGTAGLLVSATGFLESGEPLWREHTLYRGDAYEFHNHLGGVEAPTHAIGRFLE